VGTVTSHVPATSAIPIPDEQYFRVGRVAFHQIRGINRNALKGRNFTGCRKTLGFSNFLGILSGTSPSLALGGREQRQKVPITFYFLASTINVSPPGPVARLNERLTNPARFSATLIPRSVWNDSVLPFTNPTVLPVQWNNNPLAMTYRRNNVGTGFGMALWRSSAIVKLGRCRLSDKPPPGTRMR